MAKASKKRTGNLRDDCVAEALSIIAADGIDKLSLREVARRLGVSHQAPYKHYPSRDHLLAEVLQGAYRNFADYLDSKVRKETNAQIYLRKMGEAYIRYAMSHPLEYQLMFNTGLPDPSHHPDMLNLAHHAFDMLRNALKKRAAGSKRSLSSTEIEHLALFVWSTLHGLVSIMRSEIANELDVGTGRSAIADVLSHIGKAIES
ncbi:MAG: TetR/AcrR family transcriptional regulator [Rhizobiales bacterium]|nr:TetR/AcrR family transcriptional regulator [Hyphomicrobiales bacterium]